MQKNVDKGLRGEPQKWHFAVVGRLSVQQSTLQVGNSSETALKVLIWNDFSWSAVISAGQLRLEPLVEPEAKREHTRTFTIFVWHTSQPRRQVSHRRPCLSQIPRKLTTGKGT